MATRRNLKPQPRVPFQRVEGLQVADPKLRDALHRVQSNIERATEKARAMPRAKARIITCRATGSLTVEVAHGLAGPLTGWSVQKSAINPAAFREIRRTTRFLVLRHQPPTPPATTSVELEVW